MTSKHFHTPSSRSNFQMKNEIKALNSIQVRTTARKNDEERSNQDLELLMFSSVVMFHPVPNLIEY